MKTACRRWRRDLLSAKLSVGEFHGRAKTRQGDFFSCASRNQTHGRFALAVRFRPGNMVFLNLFDVVWNMAYLRIKPSVEGHDALLRMLSRMGPNWLGNITKNLMGHFAETRNQAERFARTLVKISEGAGPQRSVVDQSGRTRLGDELAAADVRFGFAIGEMQNDFVDAPAIRGGTIEPHLLGALAEHFGEKGRCAPKSFELLLPPLRLHGRLLGLH
jgi:hypothetical protein